MASNKKLASFDMIVTAVDEKVKLGKDDERTREWIVTAKEEATNDVRLRMKFSRRPDYWAVGLRFQMPLSIDQTVLQEFITKEEQKRVQGDTDN